jgi:hypothetical protein
MDVLIDISAKTSVNSRHIRILTILGFFEMFGQNRKLINIIELYEKLATKKQIKFADVDKLGIDTRLIEKYCTKKTEKLYKELDMIGYTKEIAKQISDKSLPIQEQIENELEFLGYAIYQNHNLNDDMFVIIEYKTYADNTKPYVVVYNLRTGDSFKTKVTSGRKFANNPFKLFSIVSLQFKEQYKRKLFNGEYVKTDEIEQIIDDWDVVAM